MPEMVFCPTCLKVTPCTVSRECDVTIWRCTICENVADEDYFDWDDRDPAPGTYDGWQDDWR